MLARLLTEHSGNTTDDAGAGADGTTQDSYTGEAAYCTSEAGPTNCWPCVAQPEVA